MCVLAAIKASTAVISAKYFVGLQKKKTLPKEPSETHFCIFNRPCNDVPLADITDNPSITTSQQQKNVDRA